MNVREAVRRVARRVLRGPEMSRGLERLGINPRHYWLLIDLFGVLSQRRERMGQLGRSGVVLKYVAILYGFVGGVMSMAFAGSRMDLRTYLAVFLGMTAFLLLSILISEVSNTLVNPVEALVLQHQPIDGATYTAASLSHLFRILLYVVPALNTIPALVGLSLPEARWTYPFIHLLAASVAGLVLALTCCGIFGWLIRFVPARRLKAAAQLAEFLPAFVFIFLGPSRALIANFHFPYWLASNRSLQIALAILVLGFAIAGIRCLSLDYLVRVSSIVHSSSTNKTRAQRRDSVIGRLVQYFFGGQPGRAGFEFTRRLMVRDWQVRRQLIGLAPSLVMFGAMIAGGWRISPFSGKFTLLHFLPHVFGFVLLGLCPALAYGSDYNGIWVFLLVPVRALRKFGAGVFSALWLLLVLIPHLALLVLLSYVWGVMDALVFVGYSFAMVSLYLSLEIRLIDGIPFGKQLQANRSALMFPILMGFMLAAGMMVAVQYFLIFHSVLAVLGITLVAGAAAWLATRRSLDVFETAMRHHLGTLSAESTLLYQEIA